MFFGTPEWAVPSLQALVSAGADVPLVVTNPDRPAGRKLELQPPPVKQAALEAGLEVAHPDKARAPELHERLTALDPDVATVVAYGKILPGSLLAIPRRGFVNLHFSLLPAYRGAAPVQRALMDGATTTGVTIMVLTEGMDEGPILDAAETPVGADETAGELGERLARSGADLLVDTLERYVAGTLVAREQDHEIATYAPKVTPDEARIDWAMTAAQIHNHVRALNPAPGAWTTFRGARIKVLAVRSAAGEAPPGLLLDGDDLVVGTGAGALALTEVQQAGKRRMSGAELARGLRPAPGETFA